MPNAAELEKSWASLKRRSALLRGILGQVTLRKLASVFALLVILYYALSWIHVNTYVWQTTAMADLVHHPERYECPLHADDVLGEPLLRAPWSSDGSLPPVRTGTLNIGLLMVFSQSGNGDWKTDLMQRVVANRVRYCKMHGYTPIVVATDVDEHARASAPSVIDRGRPVAWSKFLAIQKHLPRYDYVAYVDMDAVIMQLSTPLEAFIEATGPCSDIILTEDWNGPNTGIYLVKNSPWSRWFVAHAWELGLPLVPKRSIGGTKHPFEYEQRVVHYLLESNVWKQRGLSKYRRPRAAESVRAHVSVLPQCAFNSYSLHPFDTRGLSLDLSRYVHDPQDGKDPGGSHLGDFIVHFAGKKGRIKANLIEHYLEVSEQQQI